MLRNKKTKAFALALSLAMLALAFVPFDAEAVGLRSLSASPSWGGMGCGRLSYSFFHASLLHCLVNVWCFLSCVFLADVSFRKLALAYFAACSAPALSATPTIGLSGVCFALLGMVMWQSAGKLRYNMIIGVSVLSVYALCPKAVNNGLHLYCYLLGVVSVPVENRLRRLTHNS